MNRNKKFFAIFLVMAMVGLAAGLWRLYPTPQASGQGGASGQPAGKAKGKASNPQDIAAIKKAVQSFTNAFEKGDAHAVAAHWTPEGEYIADDGTKYQGREELEKAYTEFFAKNKNLKVTVEMESLRFPSSNTAVEEGIMKVKKSKSGEFIASKYSVLHVKEEGKWLMAIVREWPSEGMNLHSLDWLIGNWEANRDDTEVRTTYKWSENKKFILANFTIKDKERTLKGKQFITMDASTGLLRSWTFEEQGDFGEAVWVQDGKKWVLDSSGVLPSGARMTATTFMTPLSEDAFLWQSVERTLDEEPLPDAAPIKVLRVKSEK